MKRIEIQHYVPQKFLSRRVQILLMRIGKNNPDIGNTLSKVKIEKIDDVNAEDYVKVDFNVNFQNHSIFCGKMTGKHATLKVDCKIVKTNKSWIPFLDFISILFLEKKLRKILIQERKGLFNG